MIEITQEGSLLFGVRDRNVVLQTSSLTRDDMEPSLSRFSEEDASEERHIFSSARSFLAPLNAHLHQRHPGHTHSISGGSI